MGTAPVGVNDQDHSVEPAWVWDEGQRTILDRDADASGVVLGAPGVGKTAVLIERVARLLATGSVTADQLLVLTPTRQTATDIRDRLGVRVEVATAGPLARSMSAFTFQVVRAGALARGEDPPRLLTAGDQDRIIADLLTEDDADDAPGAHGWPAALSAGVRQSRAFRQEVRALAAECTQWGIGEADLAELAERRGYPAWSAAARFLTEYRDVLGAMRTAHRDPADLRAEAAHLIASAPAGPAGHTAIGPSALLRVVLIDDAQELTRGDLAVVSALYRRGCAVLAFGDPDIGSGAFRGARPALFAQLCDLLGSEYLLTTAHRSTPTLTRVVRLVTQEIGAAGRVGHRQPPGEAPEPDGSVRTVRARSPFEETDRIARVLREWHVTETVPWSRMAVIAHDTRQVAMLETELAARDVPTRAAGTQRPLGEEQVVRDLISLIQVALDPTPDPAVFRDILLSPFGGMDPLSVRRLRGHLRREELAAGGNRTATVLVAEALADPIALALVPTPEARAAARVGDTMRLIREGRHGTVHDLLWLAWDRARDMSGRRLADVWREHAASSGTLAPYANQSLDAVVALFDAAKRYVEQDPEAGAAPFLDRIVNSDVPEDMLTGPSVSETVTVLTPAAALGAEFDGVVIAGVQDGVWPNVRVRGGLLDVWRLGDELEASRAGAPVEVAAVDQRREVISDELRLLVRAASRARRWLVVTAVDDDDHSPSVLLRYFPEPEPDSERGAGDDHPLTLRGLVARHRRTLTTANDAAARAHAAEQLAVLAGAGVPGAAPEEWFGLRPISSARPLHDLDVAPVRVSPSAIEKWEECSLDAVIRALGGDGRSWSAGVGTILHAAMEEVPDGDLEAMTTIINDRWGELDFEADWIGEKEHQWALTLAQRLRAYLQRVQREHGEVVGAELRFRLGVNLDDPAAAPVALAATDQADADVLDPSTRWAVLSGIADRVERYQPGAGEQMPDSGGVVIVDLKTGRSEARVSDAKVVDDAQLAAYQLAVISGGFADVDPHDAAGARLLVLSKTLKNTDYRIAHQPAMDAAARDAFVARVSAAARRMAATTFDAHLDTHCSTARFAVCPIHTVKAVSAP